ncbi:hypothetical protein PHMEG_00013837 [Phytophthora megakarya]|uniref:Uncharacterized protein n=1 Tax=Phytophthora megakarya TaxID=4795 RepID=A0A225W7F4_9STRA|nr:hypothetical protein PHMEG_00013837 [Phytophthora megakarya]
MTVKGYLGDVFAMKRSEDWKNVGFVLGFLVLYRVLGLLALRLLDQYLFLSHFLIFGWQNVEAFLQAIEAARTEADAGGEPLPDDPLNLPAVVTVQNFKEAVLEDARIPEAPVRLGTTCLLCSLAQSMQVICRLDRLDMDPWVQRIIAVGVPNALSIARVYVPRPRSNTLDRAMSQFPNSLWG